MTGARSFQAEYALFFFNDTATTEIYTLSLHDALPILYLGDYVSLYLAALRRVDPLVLKPIQRSEEHTSELQSRLHLVCRLLLEKKKKESHRQGQLCHRPSPLLLAGPSDSDSCAVLPCD